MKWRVALAWLLVVGGALALRLPQLDRRPMHNDEAVNAIKFRDLWEHGRYRYDPDEFHGPTLEYATLGSAGLSPARDFNQFTETTFRLVPVAFGVGLILLLPLLADGLGWAETICASVLTAISPAMVFYSRYYIHELLLVFFTALVLVAGWRYSRSQNIGWCLLAGAGLGLMQATKETFILAVGAAVVALGCVVAWRRYRAEPSLELQTFWNRRRAAAAVAVALLTALVLFSSFFTNPRGPWDAVQTYLPWLSRAGGSTPHRHAWPFYFHRLIWFHRAGGPVWSEALIAVLAAIGFVAALTRRGLGKGNAALVQFLAFYTVVLTLVYTVLAYKTPWCLLGFWQGAILLAGVGAVVTLRGWRRRWLKVLAGVLLAAGAAQLGWQAWRASFPDCASPRNPYVYAQTSPDLLNLVERVQALARVSPGREGMVVKVMAPGGDYWPLPWYLRRFQHVGWWSRIPAEPFAPVMIVSSKFQAAFDERPGKTHLMAGYFQLRPQVFLELYVEVNLWRAYVRTLPPRPD